MLSSEAVRRCRAAKVGGTAIPRHAMLLIALLLLVPTVARGAPFIPAEDDVVLEQVPDARDASGRALRLLNARLAENRHDLGLAEQVARLDIGQSRKLGDPRFLGRAEAALAPWPTDSTTPAPVLLLRAVILQSNHDFTGSIAALQRVVIDEPASAQAWLTLAAVHQAQADYPAALRDCGQFASHTLGLAPDTCTAAVMSLTGHAPVALRALGISLSENAAEATALPDVALWTVTLEAETAERLDDPKVEGFYSAALAIDGTDPYLLGAWCDYLLDHERPQEVMALLSGYTRNDPLLLRLALAEKATGSARMADHINDLAARFEASRLRGDTVHRREEARFALYLEGQPQRALVLARANWDVQREPADARILLETALAAGHPEIAEPVRVWLAENGVEDRRLVALAARRGGLLGGHANGRKS